MRARAAAVVVIILACVVLASNAVAQGLSDPLLGISKVTVLVVFSASETPPSGASESRYRTIVELRLRTAGLRVLSEQENRDDPDINPYILLSVRALEALNQADTSIGYSYVVDMSARVFTVVSFNQSFVPAVLWADTTLGVSSTERASATIEQVIGELTDSFLNEWLRVNPGQ